MKAAVAALLRPESSAQSQAPEVAVSSGRCAVSRRHGPVDTQAHPPVLVMVSRRRVVVFPLPGPVDLNGARLWLLCFLLTLGVLIRDA